MDAQPRSIDPAGGALSNRHRLGQWAAPAGAIPWKSIANERSEGGENFVIVFKIARALIQLFAANGPRDRVLKFIEPQIGGCDEARPIRIIDDSFA
jgi:hypothetical protein